MALCDSRDTYPAVNLERKITRQAEHGWGLWGLSRVVTPIQKVQGGEWKLVEHGFGESRKCSIWRFRQIKD